MVAGRHGAVQVLAIPPPSCNPIAGARELLVGILHDVSRAKLRFWERAAACVTNVKASSVLRCERARLTIKRVDFLSIETIRGKIGMHCAYFIALNAHNSNIGSGAEIAVNIYQGMI